MKEKFSQKNEKEQYLRVFLYAVLAGVICFLPLVIINHGNFFYYGDYNAQQITFYKHLHDMIINGWSDWDWTFDLGSDTVTSYAYYSLGSPFFWLSLLIPSDLVIASLPWLLMLKGAIGSVGTYALARRFCKSKNACVIAGILFGLSSFNNANILFNNFHDSVIMIPFILLSLELLIKEGKTGYFAITVGLSALTNYFFFFGQVIFVIIYFFVGVFTKHFRITPRVFGKLFFEAVLGVCISAIIILPSAMAIFNNPRVSSFLKGSQLIIYPKKMTYFYIIKNMIMPPDIILMKNFDVSKSESALFSTSFATYIPLLSLTGIISYFKNQKGKDFLKIILILCGIFMLVPVLNQSFAMFNTTIYGRWYYMPILIASIITAKSLELYEDNKIDLKKPFKINAVITVLVTFICIFITFLSQMELIKMSFMDYYYSYLQAFISLIALYIMWKLFFSSPENDNLEIRKQKIKKLCNRVFAFSTACMCFVVWYAYLSMGSSTANTMKSAIDYSRTRNNNIEKEANFYRVSSVNTLRNIPVIWNESTITYFSSTVEPSIISFYNNLGKKRLVESQFEPTNYPLMTLLSVKYYYDEASFDNDDTVLPMDKTLYGTKNTFVAKEQKNSMNIYENTQYIPMGFTFDFYTRNEDLSDFNFILKGNAYLESIVLTDEQIEKYGAYLKKYNPDDAKTVRERYNEICEKKREQCCYYFKQNGDNFNAKINLDSDNLVFFSVPYSAGWSATVNGKPVEIEEVDNGLMAVLCKKGENDIKFSYKNKYFEYGKYITFASGDIFIVYVTASVIVKKRKNKKKY